MAAFDTYDYTSGDDTGFNPRRNQNYPGALNAPTNQPQVQPNQVAYPDPSQAAQTPASSPAAPSSGPSGAPTSMPQGIDPRLASLYQQYGVSPADRGTGFADWQYWQDKANGGAGWDYILGRLGADLSGTGSDSPAGTPGTRKFSSSGQGGGMANGGGGSFSAPGGFSVPMGSGIDTLRSNALYNTLMQRAGQSLVVNPNDPVIRAQTDAYRAEQDRAARSTLSQTAEAAGPNANLDAARRSESEKVGQAVSGYEGQLMQRELDARRTEIQNALSGAQGLLTTEQQFALQEELRKLEMAMQESQFGRSLAEQGLEFGAGLDARYAGV